MKKKEIEKEVELLAEQKEFERIYQEYGPWYFMEYVSEEYEEKDIEKLSREGRYLEIYNKYAITYAELYRKDIENELGRKSTLSERILNKNFALRQMNCLKAFIKRMIRGAAFAFSGLLIGSSTMMDIEKVINSKNYAKEINEYQKQIKEYAKKFDIHTQSDMEIIMRLMKDMHETIRGYGDPKIDAFGYWGMDVMDENGIGVCRNMVGNFVDKLNEINPEYNARIICLHAEFGEIEESNIEHNLIEGDTRVEIDGNKKWIYVEEKLMKIVLTEDDTTTTYELDENGHVCKIIREMPKEKQEILYDENNNVLEKRETVIEQKKNGQVQKVYSNGKLVSENEVKPEKNKEEDSQNIMELLEKASGNHVIVAIDIESDNVTLLIDPTNLALGVYKDGEIIILNERKPKLAIYDAKMIKTSIYEGIDGIFKCSADYIKSFREPNLSMKELEEKYGLEAQNKMLQKIEKEDSEKYRPFKESLKVGKNIMYDYDTNTAIINNREMEQDEKIQE